ncbi:short-chain dehydrogenase/reductase family protein [Favolaschia claudopus]|uniref:Short-chain dehydrogenase/reductase family protein n=1 Tax=Favolaschia claudopus TaxID=2862362 RepID=A0AAW0AEC6_9AGAR
MSSSSKSQRSGPVVLITGCSTGFGRELSLVALNRNYRVIATARRLEALADLQTAGADTLQLDVTAPPNQLATFAEKAWKIHGQIDILINNAGYLLGGAIEEGTPSEVQAQYNTNLFGLLNTTNAFLPYFRSKKAGLIVNNSSQGGCLNMAGAGLYCSTKAAVDSLSDCWSRELKEFGVKCVSIQPGMFRTAASQSSNLHRGSNRIPSYTLPETVISEYLKATNTEKGDPAKAAIKIFDFIEANAKEGGVLPLRLPLGEDAFAQLKQFYEERLAEMEKFREWSLGTDFD